MSTPNILATRIDNRLVHGQVGVTWTNTLGANLVVVANDEVSTDTVQQSLMEMVLPDTVQARFFTIEKTIKIIGKAAPHQKILLVIKTPQDALKLVKGGVPIKEINVGNMHFAEGKKQLSATVSVDQDDIDTFKELDKLGIKLDVRGIPSERGRDMMDLLKNA
ncbi:MULTISPECIES: PTS N-acetylgalactosamine transporter subunit IIB [Heyndrickxia]|jgi:PTS system N-acetylgalactosamine-specific IIB component|uniref:PTS N-acetylgalactosamine transporter subunit IIB n=1 Tax=Heyndrickxia TaxID=2837504 RepID=UPI0009043119|nr:PTS N-acetylgalactosamine transporter subunit IIB [Heyndrickxia oleronia]NYV65218.1 PTS N-acetylgalactosamine transporter subunit IIB [Bacillus sp. Gen3]OJH20208.1 PTS N-acetylgalactosamine transporter subunit IIB [Bacillus obstructivus]MBU5213027.1 PTS N-acetylgalactosamine transporter subunit IIB [Heyndrickxia oleronia]MCI1589912.1 PTS N-acetylgalactosamine transporter subunit IIB [Heyndrickxia oleronia]MCI1611623.1 PTS N-acetylgalactosamine transporter subunit IIB [Heyndrickxia oleronia]